MEGGAKDEEDGRVHSSATARDLVVWMDDSKASECTGCGQKFNIMRRKVCSVLHTSHNCWCQCCTGNVLAQCKILEPLKPVAVYVSPQDMWSLCMSEQ